MTRRYVTIHIAFAILIMAFIFVQSQMPEELSGRESNAIVQMLAQLFGMEPEAIKFGVRKAAHFAEYLVLGCALVPVAKERGRSGSGSAAGKRERNGSSASVRGIGNACFLAWCIGTAYAVTDEVHQFFVPGRSCELRDMCIDSCGVIAGVLIGALVFRIWNNREKN